MSSESLCTRRAHARRVHAGRDARGRASSARRSASEIANRCSCRSPTRPFAARASHWAQFARECGAAAAERGPRTSCGCVPRRRLRRGAYVTQEARVGSTQSVVAFHRSCRQDLEVSYQVWCAWWGQRGSIGLGWHTLAPPTPPWKPLVEAYSAALSHFRIYHPWSLSAPGGGARSNRMVPAASHPARALVRVRKHAWEPSERAGTSSAQGVKTSIFEPFSA